MRRGDRVRVYCDSCTHRNNPGAFTGETFTVARVYARLVRVKDERTGYQHTFLARTHRFEPVDSECAGCGTTLIEGELCEVCRRDPGLDGSE